MTQEEQLTTWLRSCPVDYLEDVYSRKLGQRTYRFEILEELEDSVT